MAVENITGKTANIEEQLTRIAEALEYIAKAIKIETQTTVPETVQTKRNRSVKQSLAVIAASLEQMNKA